MDPSKAAEDAETMESSREQVSAPSPRSPEAAVQDDPTLERPQVPIEENESFVCDTCGKVCQTRRGLTRHCQSTHTGEANIITSAGEDARAFELSVDESSVPSPEAEVKKEPTLGLPQDPTVLCCSWDWGRMFRRKQPYIQETFMLARRALHSGRPRC